MRKVIVAFEGPKFSEGAMRFANQMNHAEKIMVTGVFLPQLVYSAFWNYADLSTAGTYLPIVEDVDVRTLNKNVKRFEEYCTNHNLRFKVKKESLDFGLAELKEQSRYADLIIFGSETFFNNTDNKKPSEYIKAALHEAECPVVVVPEKFAHPQNNILAFDGSESSVFAIKTFAYLFPEYADNPTTVVTLGARDAVTKKYDARVKELVSAHFSSTAIIHLDIESEDYFTNWMKERKSPIVVCGAFSRSLLSTLLRHSFVSKVIEDQRMPVFISHR